MIRDPSGCIKKNQKSDVLKLDHRKDCIMICLENNHNFLSITLVLWECCQCHWVNLLQLHFISLCWHVMLATLNEKVKAADLHVPMPEFI